MKYIKYIKLDITEDINNCLTILNIEFKSKEIKNKFIQNYKNILIQYLNNANNKINDKILENLFSDVNGSFFEKQIILDILLNKIKNQNNKNLKFIELKVHSIYCINSNIKNIKKFKDKNIILTQESKTGEIYDFGIIIGNTVKLYQASINKPEKNLIRLNRNLIEIDCKYMKTKFLKRL